MPRSRLPAGPARIPLDLLVALWVALWVWVGIAVGHQVTRLDALGDTAGQVGHTVVGVGDALRGLPLIGGQLSGPADSVRAAGEDAIRSAQGARTDVHRLAFGLGASIALIPTLPLLLLYLPPRLAGERDRRALLRTLADGAPDHVDELLARRALVHLPYRRLGRVSADPIGDLAAGRHRALADAELARLGVRRPYAG
jgi:hypothetical protein